MTKVVNTHSTPFEFSFAINEILKGRTNNTRSVTLDNATSTTVVDQLISDVSVILFMPITAAAATELSSGSMYVSSQTPGTGFTITHTAGTGKDFRYVVIG